MIKRLPEGTENKASKGFLYLIGGFVFLDISSIRDLALGWVYTGNWKFYSILCRPENLQIYTENCASMQCILGNVITSPMRYIHAI